MKYLLIRHGKTDANRLTRAAFGKAGAPLNELGRQQALKLKDSLSAKGIDTKQEAAVSEFQRTSETAELAGLTRFVVNPLLNEIKSSDPLKTNQLVAQGIIPEEAINAAKELLDNLPHQKVWITHGLLIAAIEHVLEQANISSPIPDYCEIREVEI